MPGNFYRGNIFRNIYLSPRFAYYFYSAAFAFCFGLMTTVFSVYHIDMVQMTPFQLVLTGTVLEASCFLFEIPTGIVADLYSRKISLVIGLFVMGIGILIEGLFPIFLLVLFAQIIWGFGATFLSGADIAWLNDEVKNKGVEKIILSGVQVRQSVTLIAVLLSVFIAGYQINYSIIISGGLFIVSAMLLLILMPENNFKKSDNSHNPFSQMKRTFVSGIKEIKKSNILIVFVLISLITGLYSEGIDRLWSYRFWEELEMPVWNDLKPIYWFAVFQIGIIFLNLFFIELIKKKILSNSKRTLFLIQIFTNLLLSASIVYFALSQNFYFALISYWTLFSLRQINSSLQSVIINNEITNSNVRATVLSMNGQLDQLGQIIGGPIIGLIASYYSVSTALIIAGSIILFIVFLYNILRNKTLQR